MSVLDSLDEDTLEVLYDRTQAIVQAIDKDGDGSADVEELTSFFEKLNMVSGEKDEPPREEALTIIEGVGDGTVVQLDELTEILMETFAEDLDILNEIEALLEQQDEALAAAVDDELSTAWKVERKADGGDGDEDEADGVEAKENTIAASHETTEAAMDHVSEEVDLVAEAAIRDFFSDLRLMMKRRKRRLKRELGRMAEERQLRLLDQHEECETAINAGKALLRRGDDEAGMGEFVARPAVRAPHGEKENAKEFPMIFAGDACEFVEFTGICGSFCVGQVAGSSWSSTSSGSWRSRAWATLRPRKSSA